ncbi:uncharacterized protein H6S33_008712 [Morchella sextelata]|uniref:uncharacterized protein n=1 Tax=Morchella sextelata TaxID=1174677 RepID=UPI001D04CE93|nr:uncharacterized protein H6S33_008712 [Morchella sextelata]KAH0602373.1 hypothetical protein H6S33_008712 [Morchella sextelata]
MAAPKPVQLQVYPPPAYTGQGSSTPGYYSDISDPFADPAPSHHRPPLSRAHSSAPLPAAARYLPLASVISRIRAKIHILFHSPFFWIALICNAPFLSLIIIDTVTTTAFPSSVLYHELLRPKFKYTTVVLCVFTAVANGGLMVVSVGVGANSKRPVPTAAVLCTIFAFCIIFVSCWDLISTRMHSANPAQWPTCAARGFGATITASIEVDHGASNITIVSTHNKDDVLGLQLTPTVQESRDLDFFHASAVPWLSSERVWSAVDAAGGGVSVDVSLEKHRYGVTYAGSVTNGRFVDNRNFFLVFPDLGIKTSSTRTWSSSSPPGIVRIGGSSRDDERPVVDLIEDGKRVVLATVPSEIERSQNKEKGKNTEMVWRMCGMWSVAEMLANREVMEKVLVPLTRLGVEMELWGTENMN